MQQIGANNIETIKMCILNSRGHKNQPGGLKENETVSHYLCVSFVKHLKLCLCEMEREGEGEGEYFSLES